MGSDTRIPQMDLEIIVMVFEVGVIAEHVEERAPQPRKKFLPTQQAEPAVVDVSAAKEELAKAIREKDIANLKRFAQANDFQLAESAVRTIIKIADETSNLSLMIDLMRTTNVLKTVVASAGVALANRINDTEALERMAFRSEEEGIGQGGTSTKAQECLVERSKSAHNMDLLLKLAAKRPAAYNAPDAAVETAVQTNNTEALERMALERTDDGATYGRASKLAHDKLFEIAKRDGNVSLLKKLAINENVEQEKRVKAGMFLVDLCVTRMDLTTLKEIADSRRPDGTFGFVWASREAQLKLNEMSAHKETAMPRRAEQVEGRTNLNKIKG